jgi:hypothetical protein
MANKKYQRQPNDEIVEFEGKVYCVKTPWEAIADDKTFMAKAVEEGVELVDGVFPAVGIEAVKKEDGSWSEVVVWDQERIEEFGGGCGVLVWSEEKGFQEVP